MSNISYIYLVNKTNNKHILIIPQRFYILFVRLIEKQYYIHVVDLYYRNISKWKIKRYNYAKRKRPKIILSKNKFSFSKLKIESSKWNSNSETKIKMDSVHRQYILHM